MNNIFDDYKYKNVTKRIRLKINQIKEKILSPWEISNFVGNFNTYYYQAEVINTIAIALSQNISPEKIIIFDESFKLNQQHSQLFYLSLEDEDLKYLYHIGNPVSLFPNEEIYVMNILFKSFRQINEFLYQIDKAKLLNKDLLCQYYNGYKRHGFNKLVTLLDQATSDSLEKSNLSEDETIKKNEIFKRLIKQHDEYVSCLDEITLIKQNLIENNLSGIEFKGKIYKKYFTSFYTLLGNIQRPILAVKNENNVLTILCRAQINKKANNAVTLDLKSITHNSPIGAIFEGGATIYKTFASERREQEIHEKKLKQEELKEKILEAKLEQVLIEKDIKALERIEKATSVLQKIQNAESLENQDYISKIPIPYLKQSIQHFENKLIEKSTNLLSKNNFEIDLESSEVIDYANNKFDFYG